MKKPTKIPLISDPSKYYYLPWEVDEYLKWVDEEIGAYLKLVSDLEDRDIVIWNGEEWEITRKGSAL